MRHIALILCITGMSLSALTGCQKSETNQIRRARLIANENMELKKELEKKEQQISDLKKEIEELHAKNAREHEEFGNTTIKTLQMMSETEKRNQTLTLEVEKLKDELEKLKGQ